VTLPRVALLLTVLALTTRARAQEAPPLEPARVDLHERDSKIAVRYQGRIIFEGSIRVKDATGEHDPRDLGIPYQEDPGVIFTKVTTGGDKALIRTDLQLCGTPGTELILRGTVHASDEAFAAELEAKPGALPLVRNSVGPSLNLLNDAVYDRRDDWVLSATASRDGAVAVRAGAPGTFSVELRGSGGSQLELQFRPRYYQKWKGLTFFEPWKKKVRRDSICGWCSWWPYRTAVTEKVVASVAAVFKERLLDYGFEYLQVDDGWQRGSSGLPADWLATNAERFPGGLEHLAASIRESGMKPGLWLNAHFGDEATARAHPDWFVRDADGSPHRGPWIDFGIDGSSEEALDALVRPTYRALGKMKWDYVKIDSLRHLLYDSIYESRAHFEGKKRDGEQSFRRVLEVAREELGPAPYVLACWGVLPEVAGIADGCRLGTDGFGPAALQQFNSWNNVVWRNDPDHLDLVAGEEILRPVLVSMAGAQMLLTDRVEVYRDDEKIEGARRSAPVLFSVPGQLYDHDPRKTDALLRGERHAGGANPEPVDADQEGALCPSWLLEIDRPFEHWNVLARLSYEPLPATDLRFADLGLPGEKTYLVYEFWSRRFVGSFTGSFPARAQGSREVSVYAIREKLDRPQVLSTSRHISQGGVDLVSVSWDPAMLVLSGESRVVARDPYSLAIHVPPGFAVVAAELDGRPTSTTANGEMVRVGSTLAASGQIAWKVCFRRR
jgi:hypothetical protein